MPTRKALIPDAGGPFTIKEFIDYIEEYYQKSRQHGAELWRITLEFGRKAEPCDGGLFWCHAIAGPGNSFRVMIHDNSKKNSSKKSSETLARTPAVRYATSSSTKQSAKSVRNTPSRRETVMPPRSKTKAQAEEPQVEEAETEEVEDTGEKDYSVYASKTITESMKDFATWLNDEVFAPLDTTLEAAAKKDPVRIVALAGTLRMDFQRSDFNQEQRAARKEAAAAARAQAATEDEATDEATEEPAKNTRKPASGKPAARRGAPKATSAAY